MLRRIAVATVVAATTLGLSTPAAMANNTTFTPGDPGLNDPYAPSDGNGGYQVERYALDLRYDPPTDRLAGTVTITAEATQNLSRFNLDFDHAMTVREVKVDGHPAAFRHGENNELVIGPRSGLPARRGFTVVVHYAGVPVTQPGNVGFAHTDDGAVAVNDMSTVTDDRRLASTWFPANDHPSDKAAYTFAITVPEGLEAVANGVRVGQRTSNGWTTWNWRAPEPLTTEASMIAIGEFKLNSFTQDGVSITNAIDPALFGPGDGPRSPGELAEFHLGERQREISRFFASRFGPHPFTSGGSFADNIEWPCSAGPQTRSGFDRITFSYIPGTDLTFADFRVPWMAAMQYFGGAVSRQRYQDLWLNVGLGQYAAAMFYEYEGLTTVQESVDGIYDFWDEGEDFWRVDITNPGADQADDPAFATFDRSVLALHQLRADVGDEIFFGILRAYLEENRYANATTETFFEVAERKSGRDLDALRRTWWTGDRAHGTKPPRPVIGDRAASTATAPHIRPHTGPLIASGAVVQPRAAG